MMKLKFWQCAAIFFFCVYRLVLGKRECNSTTLLVDQCWTPNEICIPSFNDSKIAHCECEPGYERINGTCTSLKKPVDVNVPKTSSLIDDNTDNGHGHVVAGILIPILLIVIVFIGVYFIRRYNVLVHIRNRLNQRNTNYDEVMIGQDLDDDPPLC